MEKILVTGGTGYIGSHTIVELFKKGELEPPLYRRVQARGK